MINNDNYLSIVFINFSVSGVNCAMLWNKFFKKWQIEWKEF